MKAATAVGKDVPFFGCISIHAAREGGDAKLHGIRAEQLISIHAAREGGDARGKGGKHITM